MNNVPQKYQTRPVSVEAMLVTPENVQDVVDWVNSVVPDLATVHKGRFVKLKDSTTRVASPDYYVVRRLNAGIAQIHPELQFEIIHGAPFSAMYERAPMTLAQKADLILEKQLDRRREETADRLRAEAEELSREP